jgi:hypothetical protein
MADGRRRLQNLVEEKCGMPMGGGGDYKNWWRGSIWHADLERRLLILSIITTNNP